MLAKQSHALLRKYREGLEVDLNSCPLAKALNSIVSSDSLDA